MPSDEKPSYPSRERLASRVATAEAGDSVDDLAATTLDRPVVDVAAPGDAPAPVRLEPTPRAPTPARRPVLVIVAVVIACATLGLLAGAVLALFG